MKYLAMAGVKKAGDLTQKGLTQVGKGMDKAGKAVAGGISKTAAGIKKQGKQLANKVTKEKLMKAWKKMGEPTDTGSIINILSDAGLLRTQIKNSYFDDAIYVDRSQPVSYTHLTLPTSDLV